MRICPPPPRQSQTSPSKDDSGDASGSPAHHNILFSESCLVEILKQIFEVVAFASLLRSGDEDVLFVPGGPERDRCRMLKLFRSKIMKS